mgnify:CR=1 FL=1
MQESLPTRERGLKSPRNQCKPLSILVAPYAGAWIEMKLSLITQNARQSLPTRERGLKLPTGGAYFRAGPVAPYAGAWIEIRQCERQQYPDYGRSLRGSVD